MNWLVIASVAVFVLTGGWPLPVNLRNGFVLTAVLFAVGYIYLVTRALASMRRPFAALAWCVLGGVGGGTLAFLGTRTYEFAHPIQQHGHEDWGAYAGGLLYIGFLFLSPFAGFLVGFSAGVAICWLAGEPTQR
jgi:hypothetical protein